MEWIDRWKAEYWKSIKSFDTEEKLDLYLYRPLGFLIAKASLPLGITPTQLTLVGLVLGILCGRFFYHNETNASLTMASLLLFFAGVFDSSDGQLARMGGNSTRFGLVLDGLCDNLVFGSAYAGCILTLQSEWDWKIWPVALLGCFCHSFQSALLDFYNREFLFFGNGLNKHDYWNFTLSEAMKERESADTPGDRFFWKLRLTWIWQQNKLCNRPDHLRFAWKKHSLGPRKHEFQKLYATRNRWILRTWRIMGANFHTAMIITFAFLRRFDLYLILVDIVGLTSCVFILRVFQKRQDRLLQQDLVQRKFN